MKNFWSSARIIWLMAIFSVILPIKAFSEGSFRELLPILMHPESSNAQNSIGQFLGTLKTQPEFASLFQFYSLAYDSHSLQHSTGVAPRAILFGESARLVMTFNADSSFDGGASIEVASFNSTDRKLTYREIIFKNELPETIKAELSGTAQLRTRSNDLLNDTLSLNSDDIEFENSQIAVSVANPQKCMLCHSVGPSHPNEARYIWGPYSKWEGIYGSDDDQISAIERPNLKKFIAGVKAHPRYQHLSPVLNRNISDVNPPQRAPYASRPNLLLTQLAGANQAIEYSRIISESATSDLLSSIVHKQLCRPNAAPYNYEVLGKLGVPASLKPLSNIEDRDGRFFSLGTETISNAFAIDLSDLVLQQVAFDNLSLLETNSARIRILLDQNQVAHLLELRRNPLYAGSGENYIKLISSAFARDSVRITSLLKSLGCKVSE